MMPTRVKVSLSLHPTTSHTAPLPTPEKPATLLHTYSTASSSSSNGNSGSAFSAPANNTQSFYTASSSFSSPHHSMDCTGRCAQPTVSPVPCGLPQPPFTCHLHPNNNSNNHNTVVAPSMPLLPPTSSGGVAYPQQQQQQMMMMPSSLSSASPMNGSQPPYSMNALSTPSTSVTLSANTCQPFAVTTTNTMGASCAPVVGASSRTASGVAPRPESSRTNIIIRKLAPTVNETGLAELFGPYGTIVSSAIMRDIHTGESQGTAFIRFSRHEEAAAALEAFARSQAETGLAVQWAKKQHDDNPIGDARKKIMKLFVRNIPLDVAAEELQALFARFGPISQVTIHKDTAPVDDKRLERHIAFVIYSSEGAADVAANTVHNTRPFAGCNGVPLMVKLADDNQRKRLLKNIAQAGPMPAMTSEMCMDAVPNRVGLPIIQSVGVSGVNNVYPLPVASTPTVSKCGDEGAVMVNPTSSWDSHASGVQEVTSGPSVQYSTPMKKGATPLSAHTPYVPAAAMMTTTMQNTRPCSGQVPATPQTYWPCLRLESPNEGVTSQPNGQSSADPSTRTSSETTTLFQQQQQQQHTHTAQMTTSVQYPPRHPAVHLTCFSDTLMPTSSASTSRSSVSDRSPSCDGRLGKPVTTEPSSPVTMHAVAAVTPSPLLDETTTTQQQRQQQMAIMTTPLMPGTPLSPIRYYNNPYSSTKPRAFCRVSSDGVVVTGECVC